MDRSQRHPITLKRVLYEVPGTDEVIRKRIEYTSRDSVVQTVDLYYPPEWSAGANRPAVIFVSGLSDIGAQAILGCRINEMRSFTSWGGLVAASGLIGITYTAGADPTEDTRTLLSWLVSHGHAFGIDASRLGLWACSSHVPNALGLLITQPQRVSCAALCYGFMLDLDASTAVEDARRTWHFANPCAGMTIHSVPPNVPLFIARAGRDEIPHVNESIDRFVDHALRRNLHVTVVNHPEGPHAFDIQHDSALTRTVIRQVLGFLHTHLQERP